MGKMRTDGRLDGVHPPATTFPMRCGGARRLACLGGALVVLLALAPPALAGTLQSRVINGHPAGQGTYPAQGALFYNGGFICGGTLVSNRYFLTAAHCVTQKNGGSLPTSPFSVRLGSVDRNG